METLEYATEDKTTWGDGPWQNEPDKVQWHDDATGLPCIVKRSHTSGAWCGYVGVSKGHPLFGKDAIDERKLDVHGGITYNDFCQPHPDGAEGIAICHVMQDGEECWRLLRNGDSG